MGAQESSVLPLPTELWVVVFSFGSPADVARWGRVCRGFYLAATDARLWHHFCLAKFGPEGLQKLQALEPTQLPWKQIWLKWGCSVPRKEDLLQAFRIGNAPLQSPNGLFKVVMMGPRHAGKSTLLRKINVTLSQHATLSVAETDPTFDNYVAAGIGVDFERISIWQGDNAFAMQLWDDFTQHGRQPYRSIFSANILLRGTGTVLMCFAVDQREQFDSMDEYLSQVRDRALRVPPIILVGTKSDLPVERRQVTPEMARAFATARGLPYMEVSARTLHNVDYMVAAAAHATITAKLITPPRTQAPGPTAQAAPPTAVVPAKKAGWLKGVFGFFGWGDKK